MYREKIGGWQEKYMECLVQEYIEYLQKNVPASTKFWEMEKRIKTDKKKPGVLIEMSKSNMIWDIVRLIHDKVITMDDLDGFRKLSGNPRLFNCRDESVKQSYVGWKCQI